MQEKTLKILVAVLRVFVVAVNRGNPITLHENEVVNQVCRGLHKKKEKEIKNTRKLVVFAIRTLKDARVLYEALDSWSNDKLNWAKPLAEKKFFGLTDPALKYIDEHMLAGVNTQSSQFLVDMLRADEFKILPKTTPAVTVTGIVSTPPALIETVAAIKQEQPQVEPTAVPEKTTPANANSGASSHNVQRLITTVRNESASWTSQSTPSDLLGGLYEYYLANEGENANTASAIKLGWPERRRDIYRESVRFLKRHGLVDNLEYRRTPGSNKLQAYGIKLTDLGLEVADAGEFKDARPLSERIGATPGDAKIAARKNTPMLKGQKKTDAIAEKEKKELTASPQQIDQLLEKMQKMHEELLALREGREPAAKIVEEEAPPKNETHSAMTTMKLLLTSMVPGLLTTFAALLDDTHNRVNADGAYLALTELERVIFGVKAYISQHLPPDPRMSPTSYIDVEKMQAYARDYCAAIEKSLEVDRNHPVPIMAEEIVTKRLLARDAAIKRRPWHILRARARA